MIITEPTTTLTDYAIALEAFLFAGYLFWLGQTQQQISQRFWAVAFGCVALAALTGGTYHGFVLQFDTPTIWLLWQTIIYALSLASFCMLAATVISTLPRAWQRWWLLLAGLKTLAYLFLVGMPNSFGYAIADYFSAMMIVLVLQMRALVRGKNSIAAGWIISGILISGIAVGIQAAGITIAEHFNQNDLYHVVQMLGLYAFYQGAKLLKDK